MSFDPTYSVQILNHNNKLLLERCLSSVISFTNPNETQIIVIDNGSSDESVAYIHEIQTKYSNITAKFIDRNVSVSVARNIGFDLSYGKYHLILDNDTVWLGNVAEMMKGLFVTHSEVGITGMCGVFIPKLNKYIHIHHDLIKHAIQVHATTSYCMMLRFSMIQSGVRFDEKFQKIQGEDIDLCLQANRSGYSVYALSQVPLIHLGHGTLNAYRENYNEIMYSNHKYIETKWANLFNPDKIDVMDTILSIISDGNCLTESLKLNDISFYDITETTK
jgi:O-antigen biosynthesis protein